MKETQYNFDKKNIEWVEIIDGSPVTFSTIEDPANSDGYYKRVIIRALDMCSKIKLN